MENSKLLKLKTCDFLNLRLYDNGYCLEDKNGKQESPLHFVDNVSQRLAVMIESVEKSHYTTPSYVCLYKDEAGNLHFIISQHGDKHLPFFNEINKWLKKRSIKGIYKVLGFSDKEKLMLGGVNLCGGLQSNSLDYNTLGVDPNYLEFHVV